MAAGFAVAASLFLVLLSGPSEPSPGREVAKRPTKVETEPSEPIDNNVAVRNPSVEPKEDVFAHLPSFEQLTMNPLEKLEPVVLSIEEIGQEAVATMSPLANSAKRAADLFWKELTAGQERPRAN